MLTLSERAVQSLVLTVAALLSVCLGACEAPTPKPPRPPQVTASKPSPAPTLAKWCYGGLLCESAEPLFGYRVPWACSNRDERRYLARCSMRYVPWQHMVEFFVSRYADVTVTTNRIDVVGRGAVVVPQAVTPTVDRGVLPPSLVVRRLANGIEIMALRGGGQP